jgi:two-component system CheB/CheR fusion protein
MSRSGLPPPDPDLRHRAEDRLREHGAKGTPRDEADTLRLLHELEVHQVELELQNEELRASRLEAERAAARFAELHDFAPVGYATLARDGTILAMNFAGASLLGLERSRLIRKRFHDFVSTHEKSSFDDFLERALERRGEGKESCEVLLEGEGRRLVHAVLTATSLAQSASPEILLAIQDVTERRKWEEELAEALRLLNASQRIARLGSFTMDVATGRWTSSAALDEILGIGARFDRSAAGFLGLAHPDDRDFLARYLRSELPAAEPLDREFRVVHPKSGEVRWVWARADPEYDAMDPVRLVGTLQDITERKRLQQERSELLRVAQAARAEAEEVSRSKDAFMATLSHELRNPLTPISNGLIILERSPPGSDQAKRALQVIDRQVRHLAKLVDDLLDVTRIARGKVLLQRQSIDLNVLARSTVEDHRSLFDANGVRLQLAPAPEAVVVEGDWHRLAQVVGNLLQNAAKFCERGGETGITISHDPSESHAVLRVKDDGVGMEPEMLSRLFQPFSQADATLERSKGGLGLGMALAKRLVELHGGRIGATSTGLGKGAEFEVRLPLAAGAAPERGPSHPGAAVASRRVLIIEDNVDAADTLRDLLELQLHTVRVAHSGPEGLAEAREFRPEIVLCDIGLPGMDGYDVARAIRSDGEFGAPYLVALSGYAQPEDLRRAVESGFHKHVAKPPSMEDLDQIFAEAPSAGRIARRSREA